MKRLKYIDIAKGLLILLVVLGHIIPESNPIKTWIWSFHMPAFFIISGILINYSSFRKKTFLNLLFSNTKSLLIPFVLFEFIGAIRDRIINGKSLNFKGYIYNTLSGNYNNVVDWFLVALFISELFVFFVLKMQNNKYIIITSIILYTVGSINFNLIICRSMIASSFILFGYLVGNRLFINNKYIIVLSLLIVTIIAFLNGRVDLNTMELHNTILFVITSVSGSVFILSLSKKINNAFLESCGKHSLIIMGLHLPLIGFVKNGMFAIISLKS